ncbi:N-acetylmuramoyl-L-alanine amidase [Variovorax paradoxus]|uniref:N-acetylmuramoyl-L-alanine amidase n=1 Tax=Variovorax atrisoli TaxID=3394203 RepID=UPI00119AAE50|nr:N-acetylmuramoyl-L-alanine amidase [Variovorax paradoxus]MDR6523232.1 N-acetylmuramoyl-L-alanine amidase [Variovorax paradoxus]
MLDIANDLLSGEIHGRAIGTAPTANHGGVIAPRLLVFHYTACDFTAAKNTFLSTAGKNRVSAHLLVDTDGTVTQFVPFNRRAWHAGESHWGDLNDINTHSIGIEVVNYGYLLKTAAGTFRLGNGKPLPFDPDEIIEARHKNPKLPYRYWQAYTPAQIETCEQLAVLLVQRYGLIDVVGHDDIAPDRKQDPGPAFPLLGIRGKALGRDAASDGDEVRYVGVKRLNLRKGPGVEHALAGEPLVMHSKLIVQGREGGWIQVVVASASGARGGWVLGEYTQAAPI